MENIEKLIIEKFGEKAIPHKREAPFPDNNLMLTNLEGGIKCRQFPPSTPNGFFVVEYYGPVQMYRLDVDLEKKLVSVKHHRYNPPSMENYYYGSFCNPEVATYSFEETGFSFSVKFESGINIFFREVYNTMLNFKCVKDGFIWIQK